MLAGWDAGWDVLLDDWFSFENATYAQCKQCPQKIRYRWKGRPGPRGGQKVVTQYSACWTHIRMHEKGCNYRNRKGKRTCPFCGEENFANVHFHMRRYEKNKTLEFLHLLFIILQFRCARRAVLEEGGIGLVMRKYKPKRQPDYLRALERFEKFAAVTSDEGTKFSVYVAFFTQGKRVRRVSVIH